MFAGPGEAGEDTCFYFLSWEVDAPLPSAQNDLWGLKTPRLTLKPSNHGPLTWLLGCAGGGAVLSCPSANVVPLLFLDGAKIDGSEAPA